MNVMIEVFKTNVNDEAHAFMLVNAIHNCFMNYNANFDLYDCDRILRVVSHHDIEPLALIALLNRYGFDAEVLPETTQATISMEE